LKYPLNLKASFFLPFALCLSSFLSLS